MCHRKRECCAAYFSGLRNDTSETLLDFPVISPNKIHNISMSKKGLDDYKIISRLDLTKTNVNLKNTNVNMASISNWNTKSGNIKIRDIDYYYKGCLLYTSDAADE